MSFLFVFSGALYITVLSVMKLLFMLTALWKIVLLEVDILFLLTVSSHEYLEPLILNTVEPR